MLRRDSWIGVDLRTYLSELLSPFISKRSHNIILKGEEAIDLSPKAAQSLALVFHELATNAAKYGALSVPDGNVTLSWSKVKERKGGVRLTWREQGGPRPIEIHRQGFGSMIIKTVSAEAVRNFGRDGAPDSTVRADIFLDRHRRAWSGWRARLGFAYTGQRQRTDRSDTASNKTGAAEEAAAVETAIRLVGKGGESSAPRLTLCSFDQHGMPPLNSDSG